VPVVGPFTPYHYLYLLRPCLNVNGGAAGDGRALFVVIFHAVECCITVTP
jgi:hypothetical protein